MPREKIISFCFITLAVGAWSTVVLVDRYVDGRASDYLESLTTVEQEDERSSLALRMKSLAEGTALERKEFEALTNADIVVLVSAIEGIGASSGARVSIPSASPEGSVEIPNSSPLGAYSFVVEARGSFSAVMHALMLLEQLPYISSIQTTEFEEPSDEENGTWRMNARIRVLTTADPSV